MITLLFLLLSQASGADEGAEYLILAHDTLAEAVQPLAEWKRQKGYATRVVRLSEIAPAAGPDEIRAFLRKARPTYVLLAGDAPLLPPASVKRKRRIHTDHYYGCIDDGDDWRSDIYVGRLPAGDPRECSIMVRKILAYEKAPDPESCERAILAAEFADHDNDGVENGHFMEASLAAKAYLERRGFRTRTAYQRKPDSTALPLRHARSHTGEWDLRWAGGDVIKGTFGVALHAEGVPFASPVEFLPDEAAFRRTMTEAVNAGVGVVQFNLPP